MPTRTCIRMFNTKETYPNQSLDNDLCQAVRAGNTVYVRGPVGTDFDGNLVGLGDPRAQAEQAMKNVKPHPFPILWGHCNQRLLKRMASRLTKLQRQLKTCTKNTKQSPV